MISMVQVRTIKASVACAVAVLAFGLMSSPLTARLPPSRFAASAGQAQPSRFGASAWQAQTDLDAFMAGVLERRDENWKKLQQYLLEERERVELKGPSSQLLWGEDRTYMWYIRDGFFVRSPLVANGVRVSEEDRKRYENGFLERARKREQKPDADAAPAASPAGSSDAELTGLLTQSRRPQFIDSAYFLRFKFEAGKYALVGRETLDGVEVLRIEYYPARLFSHEQETQQKRAADGRVDRREDVEAAMERLMNKVSLVTLWVAPASRQIVKYTFDNVNFDFLPASWLLRVNDIKATMTMGQPFPGVWLPRDVDMQFGGMLAIGPIDFRYRLDYLNYREAATSGRIVPGSVR